MARIRAFILTTSSPTRRAGRRKILRISRYCAGNTILPNATTLNEARGASAVCRHKPAESINNPKRGQGIVRRTALEGRCSRRFRNPREEAWAGQLIHRRPESERSVYASNEEAAAIAVCLRRKNCLPERREICVLRTGYLGRRVKTDCSYRSAGCFLVLTRRPRRRNENGISFKRMASARGKRHS